MNFTINFSEADPSLQNALSAASTGSPSEKLLKFGDCFSWCKSEHFAHNYQGMELIGIALALWLVYWLTKGMEKWANTKFDLKFITILNWFALEGAFIFTLAFAILFLVGKNGL